MIAQTRKTRVRYFFMKIIYPKVLFLGTVILGCTHSPPVTIPSISTSDVSKVEVKQFLPQAFLVVHHLAGRSTNSLLVEMQNGELVLVDSPVGDRGVESLLSWIYYKMGARKITAVITSHAWDRSSGMGELIESGVVVYASSLMTKRDELPADVGIKDARFAQPTHHINLKRGLVLTFGREKVEVRFPGPGKSLDNLVVFFPNHKILFAGGLVTSKLLEPGLPQWPQTLKGLKRFDHDWCVPAEGRRLAPELIDSTLTLLEVKAKKG